MSVPSRPLPSCGALSKRLGIVTAAGLLASLPGVAQAGPAAMVPDCLRPSAAVSAAASPVLIPPGGSAPQLLAQARPADGSSGNRGSSELVAQATEPESLPACTYDPPLPPAPQKIRGLW
jgi:hypothetical protein